MSRTHKDEPLTVWAKHNSEVRENKPVWWQSRSASTFRYTDSFVFRTVDTYLIDQFTESMETNSGRGLLNSIVVKNSPDNGLTIESIETEVLDAFWVSNQRLSAYLRDKASRGSQNDTRGVLATHPDLIIGSEGMDDYEPALNRLLHVEKDLPYGIPVDVYSARKDHVGGLAFTYKSLKQAPVLNELSSEFISVTIIKVTWSIPGDATIRKQIQEKREYWDHIVKVPRWKYRKALSKSDPWYTPKTYNDSDRYSDDDLKNVAKHWNTNGDLDDLDIL